MENLISAKVDNNSKKILTCSAFCGFLIWKPVECCFLIINEFAIKSLQRKTKQNQLEIKITLKIQEIFFFVCVCMWARERYYDGVCVFVSDTMKVCMWERVKPMGVRGRDKPTGMWERNLWEWDIYEW